MTIDVATAKNNYIGDGTVDVYPYTFFIFEASDLEVIVEDDDGVESTLVLDTDYSVSGVGEAGGGDITLLDGDLEDDFKLTILRSVPLVQDTDIRNQGAYYAQIHEDTFDYGRMVDQQQQIEIDRAIKFTRSSLQAPIEISEIEPDSVLLSNADADALSWEARNAFVGPQGEQGEQGDPGQASRWYIGTGAPSNGLGNQYDNYLDDSSGDVYLKGVSVWTLEGNIKGPAGPTGFGTLNPSELQPTGTTQTVDWNDGEIQNLDLDDALGDVTLTLSNPSGTPSRYTLIVKQATVARDLVWPSTVKWPQGQKFIPSQSDGAFDKIEMFWDGTSYFADWNNDYKESI